MTSITAEVVTSVPNGEKNDSSAANANNDDVDVERQSDDAPHHNGGSSPSEGQASLNGTSKSEEETVSTFQDVLRTDDQSNCWILNDNDDMPFPSVNESIEDDNELVNVCPCRCLFFTLKETICMVLSALGCGVFVTGLVFLCMFLEGSWFEQ